MSNTIFAGNKNLTSCKLILKLQEVLRGKQDLLSTSILNAISANKSPTEVFIFIKENAEDNKPLMIKLLGYELLNEILNF